MKLYLIRHADYTKPKPVVPFRLPGFSLSQKGKQQAEKAAQLIKDDPPIHIFTSPLERSVETAEVVGKLLNAPITTSKALIETKSPFQGIAIEKNQQMIDDGTWYKMHCKQGGETFTQLHQRLIALKKDLTRKYQDKCIAWVSHGDPIMAFLHGEIKGDPELLDKDILEYIPQAGIASVTYDNEGKIIQFNQLNY